MAPLFANSPPATAATWTDKEVLIAVGSVIAALIPVILFVIRYMTGSLKARIKQLENELIDTGKGKPTAAELLAIQNERDALALTGQQLEATLTARDTELKELKAQHAAELRKWHEAVAAHEGNHATTKGILEDTEKLLKGERGRIKRALTRDSQTWNEKVLANAPEFRSLDPDGRRTPIISVLNLKGGVGKTTTTANLGAALDGLGYRTLLVDLDLQGSLTGLFLDEMTQKEVEQNEAMLEDFLSASFGAESPNLHHYIRHILPDQKSGLVPTSDYLAFAETDLAMRWRLRDSNRDVRFLLRKQLQLKNVTNEYDIILLDCPPLFNVCCVNALAASDYLLIPVMPSKQATARVPVLFKRLKEFIANINPTLRVLGVLPNRTNGEKLSYDEQNRLDALKGQCKDIWGYPVPVFDTHIPRNVVVRDAEDERRHLQPGEALHANFMALAREIEGLMPMYCRPRAIPAPAVKEATA